MDLMDLLTILCPQTTGGGRRLSDPHHRRRFYQEGGRPVLEHITGGELTLDQNNRINIYYLIPPSLPYSKNCGSISFTVL